MKFLHTADWHLGKKLHGYDLYDQQKDILQKIVALALSEKVDAVVIAGDIYDRSIPPETSVTLYNQVIAEINLEAKLPVLVISGNHDSGTRLGAGSIWFSQTQYELKSRLAESFEPITIDQTDFYLLPYFEPVDARIYFEDESIRSIHDAMPKVIEKIVDSFDPTKKHILVSHFFVTGASKTDSETKIEVGGLDGIDGHLLAPFDYVALGHLHHKNALQLPNARYSGSPLKYSLSEKDQAKGVFIVDTSDKVSFEFKTLAPLYEVVEITGSFSELTDPKFYQSIKRDDYLSILLTDRAIIPNIMNQLKEIYPHILQIERATGRENSVKNQKKAARIKSKGPQELVMDFFTEVTEENLSAKQIEWIQAELSQALKEGGEK
ncbi:exonuclease SbcCD subunit D [Enterococcus sp. AZ103]|uniref:exonuclease SbcCD subunit D n=1 Tax=Enterococcus sp. AZ103 TaxID=2774628 RepID=UPI003F270DB1